MFRGINAVNLDSKGRFAVPTKYREQLQDKCSGQLVVTIDTEAACLLMYPLKEWEAIEAKLQELPSFNVQARRIQRLLIGHATEVDMDNNGRILLPPLLRDYAALDKEMVVIGQGNKFELWDKQHWEHGRETWLADERHDDKQAMPEQMKELSL